MKAITIEQPWASLIALGIKDIENRSFQPDNADRILIVAGDRKIPDDIFEQIPIEYSATIGNHILMGNIPQFDQLPSGAIIGYADIAGYSSAIDEDTSIWGLGPVMWHLENAHIFDKPQLSDTNSRTDIFDIPEINPDNLPSARKAQLRFPHIENEELILPLASTYFDQLMKLQYKYINFELGDADIAQFFCPNPDNFKIVRHKTIKVISNDGRTARFEASNKTSTQTYLDDNGNGILVPSLWSPDPVEWLVVHLAFGRQLK